jgi:hypothetical protein
MKNRLAEIRGVHGPKREVTCPKCGKKRKIKLRWIGNDKPKFFCNGCQKAADDLSSGLDDGSIFNLAAARNRFTKG